MVRAHTPVIVFDPGAPSEKDKTPNHDSVVLVQDDRMGFHICIVGY